MIDSNAELTAHLGTPTVTKNIDSMNAAAVMYAVEAALLEPAPVALPWVLEWEKEPPGVLGLAMIMLQEAGWPHVAWALTQLHYDQIFKRGVAARKREKSLGHPLYGNAVLGVRSGHPAAERHYAKLAVIADALGADENFRGAAPHAMAKSMDWMAVEQFIFHAQDVSKRWNSDVPVCPDALLSATWFPSKNDCILSLAEAVSGTPFVDRLLEAAPKAANTSDMGTLFEAAVGLLLSTTPGFHVRGGAEDVSSQTDLLVTYRTDPSCNALLPNGYAVVECKYWDKPVNAHTVREFGARCLLQDVTMGILVAKRGIAGQDDADSALRDAERERARFLARGTHILVLSEDDLKWKSHERLGLETVLSQDYERLRFGRLQG